MNVPLKHLIPSYVRDGIPATLHLCRAFSDWLSSAGHGDVLAVCLHAKVGEVCKVPVTGHERVQHTDSKTALNLTLKDSKDLAVRHLLSNPIWPFLTIYQKNSSSGIFKQTAR